MRGYSQTVWNQPASRYNLISSIYALGEFLWSTWNLKADNNSLCKPGSHHSRSETNSVTFKRVRNTYRQERLSRQCKWAR